MSRLEEGHEILGKLGIEHDPEASAAAKAGPGSISDQWKARDADREATWDESEPGGRTAIWVVLLIFTMGLGAFQYWTYQNRPPLYTAQEEGQNAQVAIFLAVQEVEAFLDDEGRLPTAEELDWGDDMVEFEAVGLGYRLIAEAESTGDLSVYQNGDDLTPFAEAFQAMVADASS